MTARNHLRRNGVREPGKHALACPSGSLPFGLGRHARQQLIAGRTGTIAAVLAFIACYAYGIATHGVVLTVAFGWLPAAMAAWATAVALAGATAAVLRFATHASSRMATHHS
ncbi:hypothetical protein D3870_14640 [Noviherbaspirillum cavernae]|uniref:Uncharacterized protein n=1 Tax=Noviherbaspirillum cavernae TaxID=2320862 RepID=A0A418X3N1_9BURK|nr:hypothetical protein [Noviherbaspirillum cavernae]RJG07069.1 hypothetical protein D3870_14640 [Noviherbaspirillum cavernae]